MADLRLYRAAADAPRARGSGGADLYLRLERLLWATVLTQGQHAMPVTAGLYSLNGQWIAAWHLVSAGSIVAAIPPVAMFFLMQKHFIAGLTLGATKG